VKREKSDSYHRETRFIIAKEPFLESLENLNPKKGEKKRKSETKESSDSVKEKILGSRNKTFHNDEKTAEKQPSCVRNADKH